MHDLPTPEFLETLQAVLRIWDCLFYEGDPVLFRIAVTLIEDLVPSLVKCSSTDDVLQVFSKTSATPIASDCHRLLQVAFDKDKDFITSEKLNEIRAKYS
ncbi:unnamed protein product [Gongylonema pulchrum]|uniref:Rab-GAP TBC domain-containing protein n=1 Tax=Gongylonema pulchrum TaxID=637853 RepID=A0A183DXV3_9BILA|nr:unnamed protein product [Gongylonema pulchrum]